MPLYEYKCDRCSKTFEVIQKFVDAPLTVHEGCGGAVERLLSRSALQFKGSGFYITDYAKSSGSKSSESKSSTSAKSKDTAATPAASSAKPDSGSSPSK